MQAKKKQLTKHLPNEELELNETNEQIDDIANDSLENNESDHEETEAMERLLEEFGIPTTDDNTKPIQSSYLQHMSPMKMVGLMRPSTVYEEMSRYNMSGTNSLSSTHSLQTAAANAETSYATATEGNARFSEASSQFTRDSLCPVSTANTVDNDSLDDSLIIINDAGAINMEQNPLNDTLEVVEYVRDENSKYLLKPVRKFDNDDLVVDDKNEKTFSPHGSPDKNKSIEIIEILSSPETSFVTAATNIKSRNSTMLDITDIPQIKKRSFYDDNFNMSSTNSIVNKSTATVSYGSDPIEADHSESLNNESAEKCRTTNTLDDISSLANDTCDSAASSYDNPPASSVDNMPVSSDNQPEELSYSPDAFNDTLERMDYMMEKGRRILEQQQKDNVCNKSAKKLPRKLEGIKGPIPAILKERNSNSPKIVDPIFKKPAQFRSITPGVIKKPPMHHSRIPKPKSASKIMGFEHIQSPISIYIKNSAPTTMVANVKSSNNFFDSNYCSRAMKGLDFTLPTQTEEKSQHMSLPKKAYICTDNLLVSPFCYIIYYDY